MNDKLIQFGDGRLPKKMILNKSSDFLKIKKRGKSFAGRYVVLGVLKLNEESKHLKIGFIASKRMSNKAVKRNRAKRLMREAFRLVKSELADNLILVLIARKNILKVNCIDVQKDLFRLMKRASIWE